MVVTGQAFIDTKYFASRVSKPSLKAYLVYPPSLLTGVADLPNHHQQPRIVWSRSRADHFVLFILIETDIPVEFWFVNRSSIDYHFYTRVLNITGIDILAAKASSYGRLTLNNWLGIALIIGKSYS